MQFILICTVLLASSVLARPQEPAEAAASPASSAAPASSLPPASSPVPASPAPPASSASPVSAPAAPEHPPAAKHLEAQGHQDSSTVIPIISQTEEINPDGSFKYSFETGNGIKVEESAEIKNLPGGRSLDGDDNDTSIQVRHGSFSYTGPDGVVYTVTYIADENGFQASGDHLPTSPPIPEEIARSLSNQTEEEDSSSHLSGQESAQSSQKLLVQPHEEQVTPAQEPVAQSQTTVAQELPSEAQDKSTAGQEQATTAAA